MRIAFTTLGCKINQYETEHLREELLSQGNVIVPFEDEADVYIVNTCSVTAKSDYQCRQAVRAASRRRTNARIIVTGCYASTRPSELANLPGVDLVVPNSEKATIPLRILDRQRALPVETHPGLPLERSFSGRTRAFLKIQDGCDNRCAYCIVPLARGNSRSVPQGSILREFDNLIRNGYPEVVLTGIHIGSYGRDLSRGTSLTGLIRALLERPGRPRLRLSSIEANEITDELISFLGHGLCRHLHIPLQSGDDSVLRSMGRHYNVDFYRTLVERIAKKVPGIAIGTDIIVGFPGEGDREFENTMNVVRQIPLTHFHVFTFSVRPGTPAASMKDQVPESVKKSRSELLRRLGRAKNAEFERQFIGSELKVVVEDDQNAKSGTLTGLTDNYFKVTIPDGNTRVIGREVNVLIESANKGQVFATVL